LAVSFGLGLAVLHYLLSHVPDAGRHPLDRYLLGQAAQLRSAEVQLITAVTMLSITVIALFWKQWQLLAFDPEYAAGLGWPVRPLEACLTLLIVIVVVVGLKAVGVVLMTALLVAPAVAARQWTHRLGPLVVLAAILGAISGCGGTLLAHWVTRAGAVPTGPTIVLCASTWTGLALLTTWLKTWWCRARASGSDSDA
jgi:manganese/zinc/iron transport system permease protein